MATSAVTHFATFAAAERVVSPICEGSWESPNWTTLPDAVTCDACLERLRAASPSRLAEAAARHHLGRFK